MATILKIRVGDTSLSPLLYDLLCKAEKYCSISFELAADTIIKFRETKGIGHLPDYLQSKILVTWLVTGTSPKEKSPVAQKDVFSINQWFEQLAGLLVKHTL